MKFRRISPQFIAALGDPAARSGGGAQAWGLWPVDPGPRGVRLGAFERLKQAGGVAPAGWKLEGPHYWIEEHGLVMEAPVFPVSPGQYLVTGDREMSAALTIHGDGRWELDDHATLHDVAHLPCRAARYTPTDDGSCFPANVPKTAFPVAPGAAMPPVEGCEKQDYAVVVVIGVPE